MDVHKNARLTPRGRERMVKMVLGGQTPQAAGEAVGVCLGTVRKWVGRYTSEGLAMGIRGAATVSCIVEESGRCDDAQVVRSLDPVFGLDRSALDAVKKWRFTPGTQSGAPVRVQVVIEMTFSIR